MTAYLVSGDWQSPLLGDPVGDVVAVFKETDYGYAVELRLPRYLVGRYSRLGFNVIDVDDLETREVRAQISTYPQAENTQPGRVLLTSPEITQLLRGLNQPNSRIWVIDKQQQVRAVVGGLTPPRAVEEPDEAPVTQWQKLQKNISTRLDALLRRPDVVFEDLPSDITVRRDEMIIDVLAGEPRSDTRRSVDKKVKIVMAGHPIREGSSVLGMVMVTATLMLRGRVSDQLAEASRGLISVLVLLISPGVVGVFFIADRFAGHWFSVAVALVAGTLLSSLTTLWLMKKTAGDRTRGHSHD